MFAKLLMCRKVLHLYCFPLHHVSEDKILSQCVLIYHETQVSQRDSHNSGYNHRIPHDQVNLLEAYEATLFHTLNDIYFASVVLKATELCFLLHQEIMANKNRMCFSNPLYFLSILYIPANSSLQWRHISGHI
jgi:hypothetical protein